MSSAISANITAITATAGSPPQERLDPKEDSAFVIYTASFPPFLLFFTQTPIFLRNPLDKYIVFKYNKHRIYQRKIQYI